MKQYSGLWLLLVVSLGLFTFYSFFDGNLFEWELKKPVPIYLPFSETTSASEPSVISSAAVISLSYIHG